METPLVQQCEKDGQEDAQNVTMSIMTIVYSRALHNYPDFIIKVNYDRNTALMNNLIALIIWFSPDERLRLYKVTFGHASAQKKYL